MEIYPMVTTAFMDESFIKKLRVRTTEANMLGGWAIFPCGICPKCWLLLARPHKVPVNLRYSLQWSHWIQWILGVLQWSDMKKGIQQWEANGNIRDLTTKTWICLDKSRNSIPLIFNSRKWFSKMNRSGRFHEDFQWGSWILRGIGSSCGHCNPIGNCWFDYKLVW